MLKEKTLRLYEKSNTTYTDHRFYFIHHKQLAKEINLLYETMYKYQNSFGVRLFYMLKSLFFVSNSKPIFSPLKTIETTNKRINQRVTEVKDTFQSIIDWFLSTFKFIKFLSKFLLFLLIFYAIFLLVFALNTLHVKEILVLVFIFFTVYKLIKFN